MPFAGNTARTAATGATAALTATAIQTFLDALKAANTLISVQLNVLSSTYVEVSVAYDATAGGGQTIGVYSGTPAVVNALLDTQAGAAATAIDVYEVATLGDSFEFGVIIIR